MDIKVTLEKYKTLGDYFAPDYERDNEVLTEFKDNTTSLSKLQTKELVDLLENSTNVADKYFVADLLYLFENFDNELLESLITTAINHEDPSFNRIFIRPCINAYGYTLVAEKLINKMNGGDGNDIAGIKRLIYWMRPEDVNSMVNKLRQLAG